MKQRTRTTKGFVLVEAILVLAMFAFIMLLFIGVIISGEEGTTISSEHYQATLLAREGIEAVRNIRDEDFDSVTAGNHGLEIVNDEWAFNGTLETIGDFNRIITVSDIGPRVKRVYSQVLWEKNAQRNGEVALSTYLTNWSTAPDGLCVDQADNVTIDTSGAFLAGGNREVRGVTFTNTNATCDVVIDEVQVIFTGASGGTVLDRIRLANSNVWTGSASSGSWVDIDPDYTLTNVDSPYDARFRFSSNMSGVTFFIGLSMSDGSVVFTLPFSP